MVFLDCTLTGYYVATIDHGRSLLVIICVPQVQLKGNNEREGANRKRSTGQDARLASSHGPAEKKLVLWTNREYVDVYVDTRGRK